MFQKSSGIWKWLKEEIYLGTETITSRNRRGTLDHVKDRRSLTIVAIVDGEIVGSLTLWWSRLKKMAHVRELGMLVVDGYREMGVGGASMDYGLKWAKRQKIEKLTLEFFQRTKELTNFTRNSDSWSRRIQKPACAEGKKGGRNTDGVVSLYSCESIW